MFDVRGWLATRAAAAPPEVTMSKPQEVTYWTKQSRNAGGGFLFGDLSGLPTYTQPQLPADLNAGFADGSYTAKDEGTASPVDTIIDAATAAGVDFAGVDVCTYRNNLNKLLMTPLNERDGWALHCCYWSATRTLFLDILPGPPASYPNADKFTFYGYKFEAVCTGEQHVDATSEFSSVVTFRLGQHRVLMAAEVDAQMAAAAAAANGSGAGGRHYAELKTYMIPRHQKAAADMYSVKHPRWWLQSWLAGVPTLVLGGRDQTGCLRKVQEVPVQLLPGLSANAGHPWDPSALLDFGDAVLGWLTSEAMRHPDQQLHASLDAPTRQIHARVVPDGDMPQRLRQHLQG